MKVKFKGKGFKIFALILSCALFATSLAVTTFSRFVSLVNAPFEGKNHLNYTVNTVFIARNQEELFAAINQGYTYVQLDKNIENPLIITQKTENLDTDLILDLNGIEIQRNGYDPILNVKENVRLTIIDTSDEQTGGLYNPVGSVFNVNGRDGKGGTLTILAGKFESGPRYSEYYSYNDFILNDSQNSLTQRTKVEADPQLVTMHVRKESGNGFNEITTDYRAPIIKSYPEKTGEITYEHGNLYFDTTITKGNLTINPDTYCYYRTSENYALDSSEIAQSDWYYTYYVHPETFNYVGATVPETEVDNFVKITIYGYENVIKQAAEHSDPVAALRMTLGTIDIQDGGFYSYFGVKNAACVNAVGGNIKIKTARFSSRVPNATSAVADSVSVKEDDESAFQIDNYFNNYKWSTHADGAVPSGNLARKGEAYCILNGGNATVDIDKGDFYSSNNNIVGMEGGSLSVGGGTFTKQLTNGIKTNEIRDLSAIYMASGSLDISNATCSVLADNVHASNAIYMLAGNLDVDNTNYIISGNGCTGIRMLDGQLNVSGGGCSISGDNTYGIYSTVSGNDKFYVKNTSFELTAGDNQTAIFTQNGRINISADTSSTISTSGANGKGIHVATGGSVISENYSYTLSGNDSHGIYSTAGTIDVLGGNLTLTGARSYGIYSTAGSITMEGGDIELSGVTSYGIYATSGTISLANGNVSLTGNTSYGIYSTAEYITVENGNVSLEGTNSYGIYSGAGSVTMDGGNVTLSSNVSSYGVYVSSTSSVNVDLKDVTVDVGYSITNNKTGTNRASVGVFLATNDINNKITLTNTNVKCYEVGILVDGGSLEVYGSGQTNDISTRKASSIIVKGGGITFDKTCTYNITSSTTRNNNTNNSFTITLPTINENQNANYDNTDGVYVSGGDFTSNGNVNITHTGLLNDISKWIGYADIVIRSFAVRVEGGAVTLNKATITSSVGGGVICNGGDVTLGTPTSERSDISITTTGNTVENATWQSVNNDGARGDNSWNRRKTTTGGHAMEINNGNLTVYEGTYFAAHGDGIKLNAPMYEEGKETKVNIYNGSFDGQMQNDIDGNRSGPAGCYGVKVYGPAVINIYDGVFNGRAGGACVGGAYDYNYTDNKISYDLQHKAEVYIYKAKFGTTSVPNDGFMIYDNSKIVFGAGGADIAALDAIVVNANLAAFSINFLTFRTYTGHDQKSCDVSVYYGKYGGSYQGWNKSGTASQVVVYNRLPGLTQRNTTSGTGGEAIADRQNTNIIYYPSTL